MICGGLALNIYGIPRIIADIDIHIDFAETNIDNFETSIKHLFYQPTIPLSIKTFVNKEERQKAIKDKSLIAYSYFNSHSNYMSLNVLMDVPIAFDEL